MAKQQPKRYFVHVCRKKVSAMWYRLTQRWKWSSNVQSKGPLYHHETVFLISSHWNRCWCWMPSTAASMQVIGAGYDVFTECIQKEDCSGCQQRYGPRSNSSKSAENARRCVLSCASESVQFEMWGITRLVFTLFIDCCHLSLLLVGRSLSHAFPADEVHRPCWHSRQRVTHMFV